MRSAGDEAFMAVETLRKELDDLESKLDNVDTGLEALEYQIRGHDHDRDLKLGQRRNLREHLGVVSLSEYRKIVEQLIDTTFTLAELEVKQALLMTERARTRRERGKLLEEIEKRQQELDRILETESRSNVIAFPTRP